MDRILARGQLILLALAALYVGFLGLLSAPYIQRQAVFLHALKWPLFAEFSNPVKYGLPASRSLNIQIETSDRVKLGAWLILPPGGPSKDTPSSHLIKETAASPIPFNGPPSEADISTSLSARPTILFFHGNAATRAVPFRVQSCSMYASRFGANVLAVDYRGFGDSEGTPTEEGLIVDARATWDWAVSHGATPESIVLVGLSLGTGVVSGLGAELAKEDIQPKGVILLAPFTSIQALLTDYHLFGAIPLLQPLQVVPLLQNYIASFLVTHFNTSETLPTIKAPILIGHSRNDLEIPHRHSQALFDTFVEEFLPPAPDFTASHVDWASFKAGIEERRLQRSALVTKQEIPGFGTAHRLIRSNDSGEVVFVEAFYGGHDRIGLQDSLVDFIGYMFF